MYKKGIGDLLMGGVFQQKRGEFRHAELELLFVFLLIDCWSFVCIDIGGSGFMFTNFA